ncbi:hypothetical protein LNQ03_12595 [Klebsiella pneumoniae subsp. pneumoniae]|nr:hypothetical protein [Klebsiella pneumoniae subsp. pneumoniae]
MPNGLTPYAGVTAKSPWLASESEKRQRKICDSLETADSSFRPAKRHDHFRSTTRFAAVTKSSIMVVAKLAEMGFRDLYPGIQFADRRPLAADRAYVKMV